MYYFMSQTVYEKALKLIKINRELNSADDFIKMISSNKSARHRASL